MDEINTNKQLRIYDQTENYMRVSVDEAIARNYNKWKGWNCAAGVRGLYIDYDGNIWICNTASTQISSWDKRKISAKKGDFIWLLPNDQATKNALPGFVGNIFSDYELPKTWSKCPFELCACGADVIVTKTKTSMHKALLSVTNEYEEKIGNYVGEVGEHVAVEMNFPIPYQILWDIGRRCNYDCSYCWPGIHNRTEEHKDYDLLVNTANKLIDNWSGGESIRWSFGGGEPTLHPRFLDFLKHLKSKNQWTMVSSNGTRDHKYWKVAAEHLNTINLSAHFDGLQDEKDEDRFVRNVETICKHFDEHDDDHWIEVKLMAPPNHFDRAIKLRDKIQQLAVIDKPGANGRIKGALSLVPIRDIVNSDTVVIYTPEQLERLKNQ
jgi:MoaA/NifB/PqqE/SkfB family radical SAM enzyme